MCSFACVLQGGRGSALAAAVGAGHGGRVLAGRRRAAALRGAGLRVPRVAALPRPHRGLPGARALLGRG